ncbi:unnamed protein product, partial [Closterium sp. Naga37s-1]
MVASTALHLLSLLNTTPHSQPASQPASSATTTIPASSSPSSPSPTPPPRTPSILILSRGYAGGDEARMLQRQLSGRPVIIAVGRKRADVARRVIGQFGAWRGWGGGAAEEGRHEGRKEERRKEERRKEEGRKEERRKEERRKEERRKEEGRKEERRKEERRKEERRKEEGRKEEGRKEEGRKEEGRKEEGRKEEGRKEERRKEEGRKEEGRKEEGRKEEGRKEEGRKEEGRKEEGRKEERRKEEGRKEEGRKEEGRKEEGRKEEGRKEEGRKEEGRKEEGRGHGGVDGGGAVGPVAAVIMDDGMQLVPRGPMRERLEALQRADVVVIHNADLAPPACVAALAAQLQHHMPPHALLLHSSLRPLHLLSPSPCYCVSSPLHSLPTPSDHPFTCSPPTPASPAGPASPACHEPWGSTALKGAQGRGNSHLLLCHREGGAGEGGGEEGEAGGGDRVVACASVAGRDAVCLSAIGSPDALQATLQTQLHLRRVVSIALPDHSPFSLQEVGAVQQALALLSRTPDSNSPSHDVQGAHAHVMKGEGGGCEGDSACGRGPLLILTEK